MTTRCEYAHPRLAVVVIGRNEGDRLKHCLKSLSAASLIVYVDSGSTDQSVDWARCAGAEVVILDEGRPFTAARARNVGFDVIKSRGSDFEYVQFIDGDCQLTQSWPERAICILDSRSDIAAVSGQLRERFPEKSIYNWLCDREWSSAAGEALSFGGIVMMRITALSGVGGYRDDMIAGEEPELSVRLRAAGWRIWRLDEDMALHDAGMTRFSQWWRRGVRSGYAYGLGASLHGGYPEYHKLWESIRAWIWGIFLPLACVIAPVRFGLVGSIFCLIYPLQILRSILKLKGPLTDRIKLSVFQTLVRFPESVGQIMFVRDRFLHHQRRLIEYK
jgi:glycosyltransferase involved in cell wall biosynthesis